MTWLASFARFVIIASIGSWYLLRYALGRLGTFFVRGKDARRRAVARLRGRVLRATMEHLGATFIKLGQVMSTRPDLLDPEVIDELRHLQDRLPPFSIEHVRRTLREELGAEPSEHFAELDETPVAAASVAQVHRARLRDGGDEVAIKVLRPDVREKVERDASILRAGAKVVSIVPAVRATDPVGHLEHFIAGILDQTDLELEARHYERFRKNFDGFVGVVFPRVYEKLSGTRVLTMEFVRGRKVDQLPPGDHSELSRLLRRIVLKMLFDDGFVHADLHPGNFVITDDGRVAIFDVGLCKGLSEDSLVQYIDWNRCLVMGTTEDYVRHLRRYYLRSRDDVDWDALTRDVDDFAKQFRGKPMSELETGNIISGAFAVGRKYGLHPVTEMTLIMVAVVTAEGVGKMLSPDLDMIKELADYLLPILARRGMLTG